MNGRGWSADDLAALRRLVAAGWTDARIGGALGRARESVLRERTASRGASASASSTSRTSTRGRRRKLVTDYPDSGPPRRALYPSHLAANRVGRTEGVGGYETVLHLTDPLEELDGSDPHIRER